jgi:hypothetical protein
LNSVHCLHWIQYLLHTADQRVAPNSHWDPHVVDSLPRKDVDQAMARLVQDACMHRYSTPSRLFVTQGERETVRERERERERERDRETERPRDSERQRGERSRNTNQSPYTGRSLLWGWQEISNHPAIQLRCSSHPTASCWTVLSLHACFIWCECTGAMSTTLYPSPSRIPTPVMAIVMGYYEPSWG